VQTCTAAPNGHRITTPRNSKPSGSKATIYDIAKLAGVNPSTVSRALGKPGRVSARTRKLVEDAAAELNHSVNAFARDP
jgi:LacI family transcriptional regulator